ncbi:MAG TPA: helix-turn-helix transcriptional regulator [Beutenbergiaceae bacterium]|nr:helix-turn-helix transcriptional regulator [Beutenbergiaceae bacterium]
MEHQVGARARDLRAAKGLTQSEVAKLMVARGFSWRQTTVAKTEAAERPIRVNEAAALALSLGVSVLDLFSPGDSEEEYETLQAVLQADTAITVARQRVAEAEAALQAERKKLDEAVAHEEQAARRFHEVRGIDHDEVRRGEHQ